MYQLALYSRQIHAGWRLLVSTRLPIGCGVFVIEGLTETETFMNRII